MKNIISWLDRLRQVEQNPQTPLSENLFRVVNPGFKPLDIRDCLVATTPVGRIPPRPGDGTPLSVAVFRFLDVSRGKQDFTGQYLVPELAALLTLATGRRIEIPPELSLQGAEAEKFVFLGYGDAVDDRLIGPVEEPVSPPFVEWLSKVASLNEPHLSVIGAACRLHHGAVMLSSRDVRSAYLLLVAAIEVLSRQYGAPPKDWSQWEDNRKWEKFMARVQLSPEQQEALREQLLEDKHLKLKATFRDYATSKIPDAFWEATWQGWIYTTSVNQGTWTDVQPRTEKKVKDIIGNDRNAFSQSLGRSYDLRSGLVHRGDNLELIDTAPLHGVPVNATKPLPFSVLRSVLVELIKAELWEHSSPVELPRIIHFAPEHPNPYAPPQAQPNAGSSPAPSKSSSPPNRAARRAQKRKK